MNGSVVCWGNNDYGQSVAPSGSFTQVSTGNRHSCGVRADGSVVCWGHNGEGQSVAPSGSFTQVSTAWEHTCGLRSDGSVVCWGNNDWGQVVAPSGSFTQVSTGNRHSCGVRADGSVACWGNNDWGQSVAPSGSFTQVSAGGLHSCGLRSDGSVVCWGLNDWGQVVAPSGSFTQVSGGNEHSCGVRVDGSVVCWGNNDWGQSVAPSGSFTQVSAGGEHSCGVQVDGSVVCWGQNRYGQVVVPSGPFAQVSAGQHSCGLRVDGSVVCWGQNRYGQAVAPPGSFTQVSAGEEHSCGVQVDGSVVCWGHNGEGQAVAPPGSFTQVSTGGDHSCGVRVDESVACWGHNGEGQAVSPPGSFTQVSAGRWHSCAVRVDGSVVCWGDDHYGQAVAPPGSFTQVSAGFRHSCGLRVDGSVLCWGWNDDGQAVAPSGSFVQVSAGGLVSCGLRVDGSVVCWGGERFGQAVAPPDSFTQVSASWRHSCGVRSDRTVVCWGRSEQGVFPGVGPVSGMDSGPGQVVGVGFEVGEFAGLLFWSPLSGVSEYEVEGREAGGDRAVYRGGIGCLDSWVRCGYIIGRDEQTSGASQFRVRAVTDEGAGPWSVWVEGEQVEGDGVVKGLGYRWPVSGLVVFWDELGGVVRRYEVDVQNDEPEPYFFHVFRCENGICEFSVEGRGQRARAGTGFRVRAVTEEGAGPWTEWLNPVPPGKPGRVQIVAYRIGLREAGDAGLSRDDVFWDALADAESYDLEYQYPGMTVQRVVDTVGDGGTCDSYCEYRFLRNPRSLVNVRVRAVNSHGAGPWSVWVGSVHRPVEAPEITDLEELGANPLDRRKDVKVEWTSVRGAVGYRLEWRYRKYTGDPSEDLRADNTAEMVQLAIDWLDDPDNYEVFYRGSQVVEDTKFQVEDVVRKSLDREYLLEFRVVAVGDEGNEKASNWVKLQTAEIREKMGELGCTLLKVGDFLWDAVVVIMAFYTGGLSVGAVAALEAALKPNLVNAAEVAAGCYENKDAFELVRELSPVIGVVMDATGMTYLVTWAQCGNVYIGENFQDKNFEFEDIEGLLEECPKSIPRG